MASYRWKLTHRCSREDVVALLEKYGFEETEEDVFILPINDWKNLTLKFGHAGKIEANFFWENSQTTEIYFDYLLQAGYLLGQISCYLELMAQDDFEFPEEAEDEDEGEEDGD